MPRVLRSLFALLFALPLQAQIVPKLNGSLSPVKAPAPGFLAPGVSPLAGSALFMTPATLTPSALTTSLAAPSAEDTPAPRKPAKNLPATPADGWASRLNFQPAREFFDGEGTLKSEAGAVFAAVPKGDGAVRVHILAPGPSATPRPVDGTDGLSGRALLDQVATIAQRGHRRPAPEYNAASDYLFSKADHVTINGVSGVIDAYSGIFVPGNGKNGGDYPEPGDANEDGFPDRAGMNVEHTWPQSLFRKLLPMRSDLHHLMATFMHPNSVRGALPFGEVTGTPDYENKAGAKRGGGVFEPPDAVKGRVARGLLYYYARYRNSSQFGYSSAAFWNRQIPILLKWNREFPPDAFEARRNDLVEAFQGNRNPFIDEPGLADRIGAEVLRHNNAPRQSFSRRPVDNQQNYRRRRFRPRRR
ncbi:MAG: endonuclease [Elusimicrobia bacterium]|nr:endonuclease [Elusimicrobiota bacterium]